MIIYNTRVSLDYVLSVIISTVGETVTTEEYKSRYGAGPNLRQLLQKLFCEEMNGK